MPAVLDGWAGVLADNAAEETTGRRLIGQVSACEVAALSFCRLLERWARGDADPSTPGKRQAALRRAAERAETALSGLEEPLGAANARVGLPPEHPTVASQMKKAGYGTTLIGKWHLGDLPNFGPLKSGYDHFYGFHSGGIDYYRHEGTDHKPDFWDDDMPIEKIGYATDLFGDHAVDVVNKYAKARNPFFISLHFNAPHWPWEAPGDQTEAERLKTRNLAAYDTGTQKTYRNMISAMDQAVGRVLKALDDNRLTSNTIVIFTSDNGGERFADTWPFTGRKRTLKSEVSKPCTWKR